MTEQEWSTSEDPQAMLAFLQTHGDTSERKARLFAVACCQMMEDLPDDETQAAIDTAARFVEGQAMRDELDAAFSLMEQLYRQNAAAAYVAAYYACAPNLIDLVAVTKAVVRHKADILLHDGIQPLTEALMQAEATEKPPQVAFLRCIFGNPFRAVTMKPSLLTDSVIKVANGIYDQRAWERLPVLADALEEAGVSDSSLLAHLRSEGPHYRGCWALDCVLGRA